MKALDWSLIIITHPYSPLTSPLTLLSSHLNDRPPSGSQPGNKIKVITHIDKPESKKQKGITETVSRDDYHASTNTKKSIKILKTLRFYWMLIKINSRVHSWI